MLPVNFWSRVPSHTKMSVEKRHDLRRDCKCDREQEKIW